MAPDMIERSLLAGVRDALADTRVVFVMGARQVGKSTLVSQLSEAGHPRRVVTLDDKTLRDAATEDPTDGEGVHPASRDRLPRPSSPGVANRFGCAGGWHPKLNLVDSGLLAYLLGADEGHLATDDQITGRVLENFVVMELINSLSGLALTHGSTTTATGVTRSTSYSKLVPVT